VFAEIVVNTHQDPTKKFFTYKVPKELMGKTRIGTKVLVPFGKRSVEGYVFGLRRARPPFPTKEVKEIRETIFTPTQVRLARWMSSYYAAHPLDCLKCQQPGRGQRYTEGGPDEIETLLLVPYTTQVKAKALELDRTERKTTIIGSRSAVFVPFPNLKRIVIEEPENWSYKDERSPYYHAKDVAEKRAELEGLELELRYLIPRVEDLPPQGFSGLNPGGLAEIKIIDMQKERRAGNFSPLSKEVIAAFKDLNPPVSKRSTRGVGLVYVNSSKAKEEVRQAIKKQNLDENRIEIAGPEIFGQVGKRYTSAVMVDTDTLFNLPDFRSHEKLLLTITKLSRLLNDSLFVQTANAGHQFFSELKTADLKSFYRRELETRRPFLYPPFGTLAKLEFSAKTTAKVESESEKLYKTLLTISNQQSAIEVSPPYSPYKGTRGKAQLNIAVKTKNRHDLNKILTNVPPTWRIIVDPESLL